jgi:hypothetical protein
MPDDSLISKLKTQTGLIVPDGAGPIEEALFIRNRNLTIINYAINGATFMAVSAFNLLPDFLNFASFAVGGGASMVLPGLTLAATVAMAAVSIYKFSQHNQAFKKAKWENPLDTINVSPSGENREITALDKEAQDQKDAFKQQAIAVASIAAAVAIGIVTIPIPFVGPLLVMGLVSYGLSKHINTTLKSYAYTSNQTKPNTQGNDQPETLEEASRKGKALRDMQKTLGKSMLPTTLITIPLILIALGAIAFPPAIPAVFIIATAVTMGTMLLTQGVALAKTHYIDLHAAEKITPHSNAISSTHRSINSSDMLPDPIIGPNTSANRSTSSDPHGRPSAVAAASAVSNNSAANTSDRNPPG